MPRLGFILLLFLGLSANAQLSDKYTSDYANFYRAEDLFEKEKFSAAQEEYRLFIQNFDQPNHPYYIKSRYYIALCALYLYHADAELLLLQFLREYPESTYRQDIYFELGRYYFRKNKFDDAVEWFTKVDPFDLHADDKPEYYFKLGYAQFREENIKAARDAFFEVINVESQYQNPALYYYSHIAYMEKNYQVALDGFRKLENDPSFSAAVPAYIAQILYLQGKYEELLAYAPGKMENQDLKNEVEMAHLIGDAFYRIGKYDEAVPYLKEYNDKSATTRDEDYQLGFAYYKSKQYMNAIRMFDKVAKTKDQLGQMALYHIGECYMKQDNYLYARNAFELAAALHFDKEIEEDALYQYAILSYKLDFNPFDEAVEALNLYLERYPESPRNQDIYQYLVNVYTTMKNYKSAMASIERIEKLDFNMKNAYQMMAFNHAVELFDNAQYAQSIETFKLARKYPVDPELTALSHYWSAEAYFKMNNFQSSRNEYQQFLEVPGTYSLPQHNDAYYNVAYCYFKEQDFVSAIQNFRTFTQDPTETSREKKADAYLRIGDCYFVNKEDDNAIIFYEKAIGENAGQIDYAKYQIGLTYGFKRDYKRKASSMLDIVNNHPRSTFAVPALYEVGEAYRLMDNDHHTEAMKYYNQLVIDHPNHPKAVDAVFQIASIYFVQEKYDMAEKQYLRVMNDYDNPTKKKEALARLKDVYSAMNQPEKYFALVESQGGSISNYEKDTLLYFNAFQLYEDSLYQKAITAFDGYLKEFSTPIFAVEAHYYKATSHHRLGQTEMANKHYAQVLNYPNGVYTEVSALMASKNEYDLKNYDKAITYYEKLEAVASYPENKLTAQIGLMRCHTFNKRFDLAKLYANKVLVDPLALDNVKTEANYVLGKAEMEIASYDLAIEYFRKVTQATKSVIGAESQFNIALIFHLQEEYKISEGEVRILMKEQAGYDYWVAKALILQAKNSIGMEDYVQAEYTLNSVLNGYKNQDDGIIDEANEVMQVLQGLKNKQKSVDGGTNNIIEIGGEDGE
ncbi:MAG: tetratricopeptide repeat protein [Crocinitomicaceae bacterium]|nr:tetratricopeptide repeat protein [Crocinitomicaceae bacterium]